MGVIHVDNESQYQTLITIMETSLRILHDVPLQCVGEENEEYCQNTIQSAVSNHEVNKDLRFDNLTNDRDGTHDEAQTGEDR